MSRKAFVVMYGFSRSPEVETAVADGIEAIFRRHAGDDLLIHYEKYDQRSEDVAHGGLLHAFGGRKA